MLIGYGRAQFREKSFCLYVYVVAGNSPLKPMGREHIYISCIFSLKHVWLNWTNILCLPVLSLICSSLSVWVVWHFLLIHPLVKILHHHHQFTQLAWISLTLTNHPYHLSLPAGLLVYILCSYRAVVGMFFLVVQHLHIHVKISCLNFWDEAWWFLSLKVFGLLSSSLLLFLLRFGQYILLAFFRCLLNSGTYTELQTMSFIESMGIAGSDSVSHYQVLVQQDT